MIYFNEEQERQRRGIGNLPFIIISGKGFGFPGSSGQINPQHNLNNDPMVYFAQQTQRYRIRMHMLCDGEVMYDGKVHKSFESSQCPYHEEGIPHHMHRSNLRNGLYLVSNSQPDLELGDMVSDDVCPLIIPSVHTIKLIKQHDDPHKSDGMMLIKAAEDGALYRAFAVKGSEVPKSRDYRPWVDQMIKMYLK